MTEQPQPQPEETQAPSSIASRKRVRASVACNHCRAKRSKCDGLPGQRSCTQCKQRAIECEMPSKKRNRGHYKPQAEALMRRVQMLEVALAEGQATASSFSALQVPVSLMDRTSTQWLHPMPDSNPSVLSEVVDDFSSAALSCPSGTSLSLTFESLNSAEASGPKPTAAQPSQPSGHSSGTNDNSSFKWAASNPPPHHSPHSNPPPPSSLMLRPTSSGQELDPLNVPPPVVDYLLGLFFHKFQLMLKFISQREFMAGMDPTTGETPPPRSLLLAVLAGALRYATRSEVITAYIRPDGENVLATAAKKAFESEVYSRDISTVQTLLILAEVEIDSGNEMSGFIYSSMASKLLFELSLDLASCSTTELTDEQIEVRHWLTWIASVQDQYWAILLQRPLTIKTHVLGMSRLAAAFARSAAVISAEPSFEAQVHESLLDLMELAREVTDALYESGPPRPTSNMYATIDQLDHRIKNWFSRLPERIARGPFSSGGGDKYYFLLVLHLHLSVTQIVLHRHRAFPPNMYDSPDSYPASDFADEEASGRSRSRETVASAAVQIAKIFEMLRHREDIRQLQSTGLQWATLAAQALTNHLQTLPANELVEGVAHLQSLNRTLKQMTTTFAPAREAYRSTSESIELMLQRLETGDTAKDESDPGPALPWADFNFMQDQTGESLHDASEVPGCFASFQDELGAAITQNPLTQASEDASVYS